MSDSNQEKTATKKKHKGKFQSSRNGIITPLTNFGTRVLSPVLPPRPAFDFDPADDAKESTDKESTDKKNKQRRSKISNDESFVVQPTQPVFEQDEDIRTYDIEALSSAPEIYNRELSWVNFNWRVLQEALDPRTPLLERLKFLAITASNLDEFFQKRVGGLKRQEAAGIANLILSGWTPTYQLELIAKAVQPMIDTQTECLYQEVLPTLAEYGVRILQYEDLSDSQREQMRTYYLNDVYPILTPLAVDSGRPFPFISNLSLNLAVLLRDPLTGETQFARLKVPPNRPRWVSLNEELNFVSLEEIIIHNLHTLFDGMEIVASYPFRVTRNADIARNEDEAEDLLEMIGEELRESRFAPVVRLEIDASTSSEVINMLQYELQIEQRDIYLIRGLLGFSALFALAEINLPALKFRPWTPLTPTRLAGLTSKARPADIFTTMRQGSILVHHPYHSFQASTQHFIEAAARDPRVMAIKQTLYRTDDNSPIINALIYAAERGKQVAVLIEVKARFDEARNIGLAIRLENAGCHVAYGLVGLKTHAKLSLAVREEDEGVRVYYHIGTGNYNAKTATLYTDFGLLGCEQALGSDIMDLFNFLTGYSRQRMFRKLLVAPVNMRQRFVELIDTEIANASAGKRARVVVQMNGLDDEVLVKKLYEASQAGVLCDLIVRGNCRIRAGVPNISENIRVISVIGRFLEHPRIFYFENDGQPRYFIGSSDWMSRNLSNRVEAVVPIEDPQLQAYIQYTLETLLKDERQAWEMLPDGRYQQRKPDKDSLKHIDESSIGTHEALMNYISAQAFQIQDIE